MLKSVIYDGKDICVYTYSTGASRGVITFGGWRQEPWGDRPADTAKGFGDGAFAKRGIDEFHVVPRRNHWYQSDEMAAVEGLARDFAASRRVVTYGASMGGYGAALLSARIGVPAISLSPQFSLDPEMVPWEVRWREDAEKIPFFDNDAILRQGLAQGFLFYDPFTKLDAAQANLFRAKTNLSFIPVPFSGHATAAVVNKLYRLRDIVTDVLDQKFSRQGFKSARHASNRKNSDTYIAALYRQSIIRNKARTAAWATGELEKLKGNMSAKSLRDLYLFEVRRGKKEFAREWAKAVIPLSPTTPGDCLVVARIATHAGMNEDAKRLLAHGLSLAPNNKALQREIAKLS